MQQFQRRRGMALARLGLLLVICGNTSSPAIAPEPPPPREVRNLTTFGKLYGYVRFFHPSDEASGIDWDRFAILGARKVRGADPEALVAVLRGLFKPVAPTLQIYDPLNDDLPPLRIVPEQTSGLEVVAWQHNGVMLGRSRAFLSVRTNREIHRSTDGAGAGTISQDIDATPLRGRRIKLKARVRAAVDSAWGNRGYLWLDVARLDGNTTFSGFSDPPITSEEWQTYELVGVVDNDAARITIGCFLQGAGELWVDDVELLEGNDDDTWRSAPIKNGGFQESAEWTGWKKASEERDYQFAVETASSGERILRIEQIPEMVSGPIFDYLPALGDLVDKGIGPGLRVRMPVALYGDGNQTFPPGDRSAFSELSSDLAAIDTATMTAVDDSLRLAGVVITWNVMQHFYPYFDVVDVDWEGMLTTALEDALDDKNADDFLETLQRMLVGLRDGHAWVLGPGGPPTRLPILMDWIEDRVVVTATAIPERVRMGDVILAVGGVPASTAITNAEKLMSGSPQWRRRRSLWELGSGPTGTTVMVTLERDGNVTAVEIERSQPIELFERDGAAIEELESGIYYVDLRRAGTPEIEGRIEELAAASGVVFDLRGYPKTYSDVIQYLIDKTVEAPIRKVPQVVYPDHEKIASWNPSDRWVVSPKSPRLRGTMVFVTDSNAISAAETLLSFVENYHLAEIVGQRTAGTNGTVNPFVLPGGFRVIWTGVKVVKHDGSQHHLVGIAPTVPVERTLKGVREGRDEYLETALDLIRRERRFNSTSSTSAP